MDARYLATALLSAAILVGCADAGMLAPVDASWSKNAQEVDGLPPLPDTDPVRPLPPIEKPVTPRPPVGDTPRSQVHELDPVFPMPPIDDGGDPVKPMPPVDNGGGRNGRPSR